MTWAGMAIASGAQAQENEYRLGSGDEIRITVFGHTDLSGEFVVGSDGTISFPLVGQVAVDKNTMRELEEAIANKLRPDYLKNPSVNVEVLNYRPFYILGEVNSPGSYPYVSGMKVINAVALGGGYTYRAKTSRVVIDRAGDESRRIEATPETTVYPGDIIRVPERFF